jgi:O-antigen/teichoic acid export membrane protein
MALFRVVGCNLVMSLDNAALAGVIVIAFGLMLAIQRYLSNYRKKERQVSRKLEDNEPV